MHSHGCCQHAYNPACGRASSSSPCLLSPARTCAAAVRVRESVPAGRARFLPAAGAAAGLGGRGSLGGLGCLGGLAEGGPAAAARHLDTKGLPVGRIQLGSGRGAPVQQHAQRSQTGGAPVPLGPGQMRLYWENLLHPHHRQSLSRRSMGGSGALAGGVKVQAEPPTMLWHAGAPQWGPTATCAAQAPVQRHGRRACGRHIRAHAEEAGREERRDAVLAHAAAHRHHRRAKVHRAARPGGHGRWVNLRGGASGAGHCALCDMRATAHAQLHNRDADHVGGRKPSLIVACA
jgi:hypothetical protein